MNEQQMVQQIAEVVEKFNDLEMHIGLTLSKCIAPATQDYGFLRELIFHNTIIGFAAKVQLLERILKYWSWSDLLKHTGRFKELMKLRNAFAHTPTAKRQLLVYFPPDAEFGTPLGSESIIEKKTPTSWENIERSEAFSAFIELHQKCADLLAKIDEKVKESLTESSARRKE